ncbi:hypothetical protein QA639_09355 [Bradyrhizobium pachyrhizi]|uniref:hypothetical protein n=1 Tax=Bradyrhizobium TaxID=374 RepID=UPI000AE73322|nr:MULTISPECIES: hypothetical protein [Bradyrhizobium]WFU57696.1 hypothetical protein QA639_09355 [Bradyrhizobium pachyrhizi]WOH85570.1 hypothetical protein RX327_08915 [Bradyrhizobium sp. BEA-2-5]
MSAWIDVNLVKVTMEYVGTSDRPRQYVPTFDRIAEWESGGGKRQNIPAAG